MTACYSRKEQQWQPISEAHLTTFDNLAQKIDSPVLCVGEIDQEAVTILQQGSRKKAQVVSPASRLRRSGYLAEIAALRLEAGDQDDPDALVPIYTSSP